MVPQQPHKVSRNYEMRPWGGGTGGFRHYVVGFVLLPYFSWMTRPNKSFDSGSTRPGPVGFGPTKEPSKDSEN
jgi:hypothetical protein